MSAKRSLAQVIRNLEQASSDLGALHLYDDAEELNRVIRFLTGDQIPIRY